MFYVGADVSKGRWLAVKLSEGEPCEVRLFDTIRDIWNIYKAAQLILIDIPIGLREKGSQERQCDKEARRLLKWPRCSSIFRAPCRGTLEYYADYPTAKEINKLLTGGKSLSKQSFSIMPKIKEVDDFLQEDISARSTIREIHPEVCFWALNGGKPVMSKKKEADGFQERMTLLRNAYRQTGAVDAVIQHAKSKYPGMVADDIADALVAAATALLTRHKVLTLPEKPEVDERGLPMEMVYYLMQAEKEG